MSQEWTLDDKIEQSKYIRMFGLVKFWKFIHNEMHFHNELMSVRFTNYLQLKYYYNTIDLRHYCEYLEKLSWINFTKQIDLIYSQAHMHTYKHTQW